MTGRRRIQNHRVLAGSTGWVLSLYLVHYNVVPVHKSLRMTPAMAAGVSNELQDMEWLANLIEAAAPKPGPRGPCRKKR